MAKRELTVLVDGLCYTLYGPAIRLMVLGHKGKKAWFSLVSSQVGANERHNTMVLAKALGAPYSTYTGLWRHIWLNDLTNKNVNKDRVAEIVNTLKLTRMPSD